MTGTAFTTQCETGIAGQKNLIYLFKNSLWHVCYEQILDLILHVLVADHFLFAVSKVIQDATILDITA